MARSHPSVRQIQVENVLPSEKHVREMYTPLNPSFIQQNWDMQVYTLFFVQKKDCGYSLRPPRRGDTNVYSQSMF